MATTVLARGTRRELKGKAYKAARKTAMTELLTRYRSGYSRRAVFIDLVKFLPPIYIVASCVVDGAYDFAWQTGLNLYLLGSLLIVASVGLPRWRINHAKKKGYRTSAGTWKFIGLLIAVLGVFYIISGIVLSVHDNYHLWHALATNKEMRDDFGRNGLEGVYTGLLLVYVRWNPVSYQLKGSPADRLFQGWWPNSRQSDEQVPLRAWMIWACLGVMALITAVVFFIGWEANSAVTTHADVIHHWFKVITPWHVHSPVPGFVEHKVNHAANVVTNRWWVWLAGFIGGRFLARIPAKGIINTLQEDSVQRRLSRKGGVLEKAFSWFRSLGWNAHLAQVYYGYAAGDEQVAMAYASATGTQLEPSTATIREVEEALAAVPEDEIKAVFGRIASAAQTEVDGRDPGILIPFKVLAVLSPLLFVLGLFFVWTPLVNHLFGLNLPVLTHHLGG